MRTYHPLVVEQLSNETRDSLRVGLRVPPELSDEFSFVAGQHLPLQVEMDGKKVRRTYSICSSENAGGLLEIGIRLQPEGVFSTYAKTALSQGDCIESMPPTGRFTLEALDGTDVLLVAAGSGITPVLAMLRSLLESQSDTRVVLFYGNRRRATTMFIEDLYALKNRYPERLQLHFVFSQEPQEFDVMNGRLSGKKVTELYRHFCSAMDIRSAFVCGPDSMIDDVTAALEDLNIDSAQVHAERFGAPRGERVAAAVVPAKAARVTVIMDGQKQTFDMHDDDTNLVDSAASQGIDLPYSCKGGVCATCRCHVREGQVQMATNYGLEPWEVEQGYVLACQSTPVSDTVTLDYDRT